MLEENAGFHHNRSINVYCEKSLNSNFSAKLRKI